MLLTWLTPLLLLRISLGRSPLLLLAPLLLRLSPLLLLWRLLLIVASRGRTGWRLLWRLLLSLLVCHLGRLLRLTLYDISMSI